jgi:hypothetical protein
MSDFAASLFADERWKSLSFPCDFRRDTRHCGEFWKFFAKILITFDGVLRLWRDFFKMQVISVAYMLVRYGFHGMEAGLLAMPGRAANKSFSRFSLKIKKIPVSIF